MRETFRVPGANCPHRVRSITEESSKIPGVREVVVDLTEKTVTVDYDEAVIDLQLCGGIEEAGYEVAA